MNEPTDVKWFKAINLILATFLIGVVLFALVDSGLRWVASKSVGGPVASLPAGWSASCRDGRPAKDAGGGWFYCPAPGDGVKRFSVFMTDEYFALPEPKPCGKVTALQIYAGSEMPQTDATRTPPGVSTRPVYRVEVTCK